MRAGGERRGGSDAQVRSVVLGTAGHIDHGKTALVLALTGTDTDRLPEEKARGITIDLGFAALDLAGPDGQRFDVSLIDVPGHHAFVRNMLAGAGGIDAVMLVVSADEGVKAQTVEHLQICRLLGIGRGLVVLTKKDLVSEERLRAAQEEVAALVEGTFLEGAPVLAVSALRLEGFGELKAALARLVAEVPARSADRVARLPVDRVFTVRGFGTVVTGTLQAGDVRAGDGLVLEPGARPVRVRGVQVHGWARAAALAPDRVALNLAGVEVADIARGDTVLPAGTIGPSSAVDAEVELLPGSTLRHRQRVRVHAFASEALATVLLYDEPEVPVVEGQQPKLVRLRLEKAMVLTPGDRFVLRLPSPAETIGGGCVLDAQPIPTLRKTVTAAWLREMREAEGAAGVRLRVRRRGEAGVTLGELVGETGWTREALQRVLALMLSARELVAGSGGELLVDAAAVQSAESRVLQEVEQGASAGVGRAALRTRLRLRDAVFALAVERLEAARRVVSRGELLALPTSGGEATPGVLLTGKTAEIERLYRSAGLASPIVSEAAERMRMPPAEMRAAITTLLRSGKLVRMGSDALLMHGEPLAKLVTDLRKERGRRFDVSWFKAYTGLTRKHAIPLLEYLDGSRVTRLEGGTRTVL